MKKVNNQIVILDFILVLNALLILMCPFLKIMNIKYILMGSFLLYGFISALKFISLKRNDDLEYLYYAICQAFFSSFIYVFDIGNSIKDLAYFLILWILVMSIIKLVKGDYYHDRHNKLWIPKVFSLIIFMVTGVITCINFNISEETTIVIIGYFFLINYAIDILNHIFELVRK